MSCSYARGYRTDNSHYYMHSSLSGLPEALTNCEGEIVWQGQYSAWGHLQRQTRPTSTFNREQNLRFQGQYFDKDKFVGNKFEQRLRWPVGRVSG